MLTIGMTATFARRPLLGLQRTIARLTKAAAAFVILTVGITASPAAAQETFSFESVNLPGHYIRHVFGQGAITTVRTPLELADASFIVRPALNGAYGAISFESANYPGHFLRHQDYRIILSPDENTELFRNDATFVRRGLAEFTADSYEFINFPNHYIRHQNFELWLVQFENSDLYRKDTSFRQQPGLAPSVLVAAPAPAETPVPENPIATVVEDVDVYDAPGGEGNVIGMLTQGTNVPILGACEDNWCHVQAQDVPGGNGWVWYTFLTL